MTAAAADLPPLADDLRLDALDPTLLRGELLHVIRTAIADAPRSAQVQIGPSEIGTECDRRVGYKLLGVPAVHVDLDGAWRPTVGTAVHAWLADAFGAAAVAGWPDRYRWLTEHRVTVGTVPGMGDITGTADLFDRATGTVIDWKIVGVTTLRRVRAHGASAQYRAQAHLYGRGFTLAGVPVRNVAIAYLPSAGQLTDAHLWTEPYDEAVALDALARLGALHHATTALGPAALPLLPTADAYCTHCPWFANDTADLQRSCPGHPTREKYRDPIHLIAASTDNGATT